jgi:hypothetical protein
MWPPAVEVADDVAHELLGHHHSTRMTGSRAPAWLLGGVLERHRAGDLEPFVRVDVVVRAVMQLDADVVDQVPARTPVVRASLLPLDRLDELAESCRRRPVDELEALTRFARDQLDLGVPAGRGRQSA